MSQALVELVASVSGTSARSHLLGAIADRLARYDSYTSLLLQKQVIEALEANGVTVNEARVIEPFVRSIEQLRNGDEEAWASLLFLALNSYTPVYDQLLKLSPFADQKFVFIRRMDGVTKPVNFRHSHISLPAVLEESRKAPVGWSWMEMDEEDRAVRFISIPNFEPVAA